MPRNLSNWLDSFEKYCESMEAPREWIRWAGISTLSCSLKRNCFTYYRDIKFFPNQYIILVGPPGIGKGECIGRGYDISSEAGTINYIKDWHTPQEVLEEMANGFNTTQLKIGQTITANTLQDHTCCIVAPELAVFLQNYDNLHSLMCAWWDQNKFEYKTKNKGKHVIDEMSVSLLGGCVPDYIRSLSKDRLAPITGGFTARTMFIYATKKFQLRKSYFGQPVKVTSKLRDDLINDLKHISTLSGELTFDKEAKDLWEQTYEAHNTGGITDSDASTNFKSRISSHIVKTAITTSVSKSDDLTITRDNLERAIAYVEDVRDKVDIVFRCVGESPVSTASAKLLAYIDTIGSSSYKQILKFMYRDVTEEQLVGILNVLVKIGLVRETMGAGNNITYESAKVVTLQTIQQQAKGAGYP
jgi:hypothetical protein